MLVIDLKAISDLVMKLLGTVIVLSGAIYVLAWFFSDEDNSSDILHTVCEYAMWAVLLAFIGFFILFVIAVLHSIWSA